jgi:hypothetical protein
MSRLAFRSLHEPRFVFGREVEGDAMPRVAQEFAVASRRREQHGGSGLSPPHLAFGAFDHLRTPESDGPANHTQPFVAKPRPMPGVQPPQTFSIQTAMEEVSVVWGRIPFGDTAMRFLEDGADIPDELIRAVTDGDAVFLCGAGVSLRAGMPTFHGLTEQVYRKIHET